MRHAECAAPGQSTLGWAVATAGGRQPAQMAEACHGREGGCPQGCRTCTTKGIRSSTACGSIHVTRLFFQAFSSRSSASTSALGLAARWLGAAHKRCKEPRPRLLKGLSRPPPPSPLPLLLFEKSALLLAAAAAAALPSTRATPRPASPTPPANAHDDVSSTMTAVQTNMASSRRPLHPISGHEYEGWVGKQVGREAGNATGARLLQRRRRVGASRSPVNNQFPAPTCSLKQDRGDSVSDRSALLRPASLLAQPP